MRWAHLICWWFLLWPCVEEGMTFVVCWHINSCLPLGLYWAFWLQKHNTDFYWRFFFFFPWYTLSKHESFKRSCDLSFRLWPISEFLFFLFSLWFVGGKTSVLPLKFPQQPQPGLLPLPHQHLHLCTHLAPFIWLFHSPALDKGTSACETGSSSSGPSPTGFWDLGVESFLPPVCKQKAVNCLSGFRRLSPIACSDFLFSK